MKHPYYLVIDSTSGHCCFCYSLHKVGRPGGGDAVCECFSEFEAMKVFQALNPGAETLCFAVLDRYMHNVIKAGFALETEARNYAESIAAEDPDFRYVIGVVFV